MKKFAKSFDSYEIGPDRPITVELHAQGVKRYLALVENPLYYLNAFQYTNGELYRAILGYETIWDKEVEDSLMTQLDFFLNRVAKRREYFLEEIVFDRTAEIRGLLWKRGIKPKITFRVGLPQQEALIPSGSYALARTNLLDKPRHVDIEFDDGTIFTVPLIHYLELKKKHIRSLDHEKSNNRSADKVKGTGGEIASKDYPPNVLDLRGRLKRRDQMSKAQKALQKRLV